MWRLVSTHSLRFHVAVRDLGAMRRARMRFMADVMHTRSAFIAVRGPSDLLATAMCTCIFVVPCSLPFSQSNNFDTALRPHLLAHHNVSPQSYDRCSLSLQCSCRSAVRNIPGAVRKSSGSVPTLLHLFTYTNNGPQTVKHANL